MANRSFNRIQHLEKEVKVLNLKIVTDGSADVSSISGEGFSSASHAANVYTINLQDKFPSLLGINVISKTACNFKLNSEDVSSAKQVIIQASASNTSSVIYVTLFLKNSNV